MAEKGASTHPGLTWQGVVENTDPGNIQELGWMQRWSQHDGIVPCHASVVKFAVSCAARKALKISQGAGVVGGMMWHLP